MFSVEDLIENILVNEFGSTIKENISYELFVEMVSYNLKKKTLKKIA